MPDVIAVGDYVRGITGRYGITNKNMILGLVCRCTSNDRIVIRSVLHEKRRMVLFKIYRSQKRFCSCRSHKS